MRHALTTQATCCLLVLSACTTVPVTGRQSLNLLPESDMVALAADGYSEVLKEATLSQDAETIARVRRVGGRIAAATESYLQRRGISTAQFQWEFNVIEDDEAVNAWAMPGGKVAVYTGILSVADDDAGLATVLGHEIAHVLARHGNERMSQAMLTQLGSTALSVALRDSPGLTQDLFMTSYGAAAQLGLLLPYSRLHESEADRIGLTLMAIAGYDPREAIGFWGRMSESGDSRPPQFLSTHPLPQTRIDDLQRYMPEALAAYRPAS